MSRNAMQLVSFVVGDVLHIDIVSDRELSNDEVERLILPMVQEHARNEWGGPCQRLLINNNGAQRPMLRDDYLRQIAPRLARELESAAIGYLMSRP